MFGRKKHPTSMSVDTCVREAAKEVRDGGMYEEKGTLYATDMYPLRQDAVSALLNTAMDLVSVTEAQEHTEAYKKALIISAVHATGVAIARNEQFENRGVHPLSIATKTARLVLQHEAQDRVSTLDRDVFERRVAMKDNRELLKLDPLPSILLNTDTNAGGGITAMHEKYGLQVARKFSQDFSIAAIGAIGLDGSFMQDYAGILRTTVAESIDEQLAAETAAIILPVVR